MATIQREVRRRGLFGQVVLASFWLWQIVMIVWVARYWSDAGGDYATATGAAQTGAALGLTIGTGLIAFFWLAGSVVFGLMALLTRGPKLLITEDE